MMPNNTLLLLSGTRYGKILEGWLDTMTTKSAVHFKKTNLLSFVPNSLVGTAGLDFFIPRQ